MIQLTLNRIHLGVLLCGGLLVPSLPAAEAIAEGQTEELHPFTHVAYIPADAALGTIRFEGISRAHVPAWIKHTANASYCAGAAFRDPGGSRSCPSADTVVSAVAYQVTYSYRAEPMASDESANRHFEFRVYFRYNELPPEVLQAAAASKLDRADAAAYFAVNTTREPARRLAIDSARSSFCPGAYQDAVWTHSDVSCLDDIHYTAVAAPSDQIAVRIDPVSTSRKGPAIASASTPGR